MMLTCARFLNANLLLNIRSHGKCMNNHLQHGTYNLDNSLQIKQLRKSGRKQIAIHNLRSPRLREEDDPLAHNFQSKPCV